MGCFVVGSELCTQFLSFILAENTNTVVYGVHENGKREDNAADYLQSICYRPLTDECCSRRMCIWYKKNNVSSAIEKFVKLYSESEFRRG